MNEFLDILSSSTKNNSFVKLTLSKPVKKQSDLRNVYVKGVTLKDSPHYSFTYHYQTKDIVKNHPEDGWIDELKSSVSEFQVATLWTTDEEITLRTSKKGASHLSRKRSVGQVVSDSHDRTKQVLALLDEKYLQLLGVSDREGKLIPRMSDKYRQINKYLEILDGLVKEKEWQEPIHVVDMGSGKGYLTFALYNYFTQILNYKVEMTGVELRQELVNLCNTIASQCNFHSLRFEESTIEGFNGKDTDILIALHACDTATDDAIAKGIQSGAQLIVCAPCCHKQIRQQLKGKSFDSPLLKYGIYKERMFEMVTDTLRALFLEMHGYKTNLFEFISSEHTNKNIMLTAVKSDSIDRNRAASRFDQLKKEYGIEYHYLEKLIR
ncbi:MAG: SAM-dependent methyltransferase [Cyclobacteriaceae bacterium]